MKFFNYFCKINIYTNLVKTKKNSYNMLNWLKKSINIKNTENKSKKKQNMT